MPEHVALCGPVASRDLLPLLGRPAAGLPSGYEGAPLLVTLIQTLLEQGHRVTVVTLSRDLPIDRPPVRVASVRHAALQLVFCPLRARAWQPVQGHRGRILDFYRVERDAMAVALREAGPDVVHAHWLYEFAWAALDSGLPTVVTSHDSPWKVARLHARAKPTISLYRALRVLMARQVLRRASHLTAVSPYMRDEILRRVPGQVRVVPNPVDGYSLSLGTDRRLGDRLHLAMVCNGWSDLKNAPGGLRAFARLLAHRPEVRLHLFGQDFEPQGLAWHWCRAQPDLQGCFEASTFHGPMTHRDVLDALSRCDLLLHPSREETFGLVLAEAMALGLPVVAGAGSGAVPWVVDDPRCLCDIEDPTAIARTALALLQPAVYAEVSARLRASVRQRFSREGVVQQYLQAYREAMHRSGEQI